MNDLELLRKSIDEIDNAIADLFLRRMDLVKSVLEYKRKHNLPVLDKLREEQLKAERLSKVKYYQTYYTELLDAILKISKQFQEDNYE